MARKSSKMMQLLRAYDEEYMARAKRLNRPQSDFDGSTEHKKTQESYIKCQRSIYKRCYPRGKAFNRLINLALGFA